MFGSRHDVIKFLSPGMVVALQRLAAKNELPEDKMAAQLLTEAVWARDEGLAVACCAGGYAEGPMLYRMVEGVLHAALDAGADELQILVAGLGAVTLRVRIGQEEQDLVPKDGIPRPIAAQLLERIEKRTGLFWRRWDLEESEASFTVEHPAGVRREGAARYLPDSTGLRIVFRQD